MISMVMATSAGERGKAEGAEGAKGAWGEKRATLYFEAMDEKKYEEQK